MWAEWQVRLVAEDMPRELFGDGESPAGVEAGGVVRRAMTRVLHGSRRAVGAGLIRAGNWAQGTPRASGATAAPPAALGSTR